MSLRRPSRCLVGLSCQPQSIAGDGMCACHVSPSLSLVTACHVGPSLSLVTACHVNPSLSLLMACHVSPSLSLLTACRLVSPSLSLVTARWLVTSGDGMCACHVSPSLSLVTACHVSPSLSLLTACPAQEAAVTEAGSWCRPWSWADCRRPSCRLCGRRPLWPIHSASLSWPATRRDSGRRCPLLPSSA